MASEIPTTPPSKSLFLVPDTVPFSHLTSQSSYRTGDLVQGRIAVVKDLQRYREVPYHNLVRSVFGPHLEILQIHQKLIEDGLLSVSKDGGVSRWSDFMVNPSKMSAAENVAFEPLVAIISKIFGEIPNCAFGCSANPHAELLSERDNTSRPDAYVKCSGSDKTHWFDVAIPFEFKKANYSSDTRDNEWKMIWSLHNIMREDPLRRFALGITIEDTDLRIWHASRALLTVSEPVDFTTQIDDVISLFYLIGSKTKVDLGWDPTVKRIFVKGTIQYEFNICGQRYTTTRPLATFGADAMVGRGTRVYEARDEHGNTVAIKDSWRDEDREPEGRILEMIFEDIHTKFGEKEATSAERYFVRVRHYEDVCISGRIDKTFNPGEVGIWVNIDDQPILSRIRHLPSIGHIPHSSRPPCEAVQRTPRQGDKILCRIHSRTVYTDVGVALMNVKCLDSCFTCLYDSGRALYYLHKAGWVHRDFSVANVLWVVNGSTGVGKLSDFEFAKRVDCKSSYEVRTGTMDFMAIEVSSQTYLFAPTDIEEASQPSFRMNALHDLESQWWSAMWILFYYTDAELPTETVSEQKESYHMAFPPMAETASRRNFFMLRHVLLRAHETLAGTYKDQCKRVINLARSLHDFYWQAEKSYPYISVGDDILERAHRIASECYSAVVRNLRIDLPLEPLCVFREKKRHSESQASWSRKKKKRSDK